MAKGKLNNVLNFKDYESLDKLENKPGKVLEGRIENFETYNEWFGQKFFTGHDKGEKGNSKEATITELDEILQRIDKTPEKFGESSEDTRNHIMEKGEENGWRGKLNIVRSRRDDLIYVRYIDELTPLQHIGSGAASGTRR